MWRSAVERLRATNRRVHNANTLVNVEICVLVVFESWRIP